MWRAVLDAYDLDEHETRLLTEAVRTVSDLDQLNAHVREEGVVITTPQGPRAHPALVEARQQRIALARLLAALRLPNGYSAAEGTGQPSAGDEEAPQRPQQRGGARGPYKLKAV